MDCYRTGADGSDAAEFAALHESAAADLAVRDQFKAVQAWDTAISQAMHDVPVPTDLADRLLAAMGTDATAESDVSNDTLVVPVRAAAWWHRWPARVAAAATCVAALVVVVLYLGAWNDTLTRTQVAGLAHGWIGQLDEASWQQSVPPGNEYQHPALAFRLDGWQRFDALHGADAVAYRATVPPARARAVLFVIKTRQGRRLPKWPSTVPDSTTGNICIGSWKSGGHLYVLAVQGTPQTYRRVVKSRAIAMLTK